MISSYATIVCRYTWWMRHMQSAELRMHDWQQVTLSIYNLHADLRLELARLGDFGMHLAQDTRTRNCHSGPPLCRHGVALDKDAQQDGKDLASRRNCRTHKRIKVRNGIKDEGLPNSTAYTEVHYECQHGWVFGTKLVSGPQFSKDD